MADVYRFSNDSILIESHIRATGEVMDTAVAERITAAGSEFCAFVVPGEAAFVSGPALGRKIDAALPSFAPVSIMVVDDLYRLPNGDLDLDALLASASSRAAAPPVRPRDNTEAVIERICAEILNVPSVNVTGDLIELGLDRTGIRKTARYIDARFGVSLEPDAIYSAPTIEALARRTRWATPTVGRRGVLIPLRETGDDPPLFCIAGAAGLGRTFRYVAKHLPETRPVYALQSKGIEGHAWWPDHSVEAHARRYLRAIRRLQPEGPYFLVGHSLGGLITFEIARRLIKAGDCVKLVALIDASLEQEGVDEIPGGRRDKLRGWAHREVPYVTRKYWKTRHNDHFAYFWDIGLSMGRRYRPATTLSCPAVMYKASEESVDLDSMAEWFDPRPPVHSLPGNHLSILREPAVTQLAHQLADDLAQAEATR